MGFANLTAYADSLLEGRSTYAAIRKTPTTTIGAPHWMDFSMVSGQPRAQYYAAAPGEAKTLSQSANGGLFHGGNVAPATKHLARITLNGGSTNIVPMPIVICDYLMFYPFIDTSVADEQPMVNDVALSRSTTGEGVRIMAVVVGTGFGNVSFRVTYTNSQGVSGRVSQTVWIHGGPIPVSGLVGIGPLMNAGARGPFVPLQAGDTGVRSIESFQMIGGVDTGLLALVLVKPIASAHVRDATAPTEINYMMDHAQLPVIEDDAFLGFIGQAPSNVTGSIFTGDITTVWSN